MSESNSFDPSKAIEEIRGDRNLSIIAVGAIAVIIGLFLPWYSIDFLGFSTSASPGIDNSTGFMLTIFSLAAVATSLNVFKQDKKNMAIVAVVAAVLCGLIMLNNWPDSALGDTVSIGIGYWLGIAGSVAMFVGSLMRFQLINGKAAPKAAPKKSTNEDK